MNFLLPREVAFKCSIKQGMIFYVASAILTNGRYPYICSSAVVKQGASNRFTNCHTYYFFISGQKLKTYQSSDWKNTGSLCIDSRLWPQRWILRWESHLDKHVSLSIGCTWQLDQITLVWARECGFIAACLLSFNNINKCHWTSNESLNLKTKNS